MQNEDMYNAQDIDVGYAKTNVQNLVDINKYGGYYWQRYDEE